MVQAGRVGLGRSIMLGPLVPVSTTPQHHQVNASLTPGTVSPLVFNRMLKLTR
jgi:hypothetical protein